MMASGAVYCLKAAVVGEQAVGKTSALRAFSGLPFEAAYHESGDVRIWDALLPPAGSWSSGPRRRRRPRQVRPRRDQSGRYDEEEDEEEDDREDAEDDEDEQDMDEDEEAMAAPEPRMRAQFWDCGTRSLDNVRLERMLDGAMCALILYDVTDYTSYERATTRWLDAVRATAPDKFVVLVGCKVDQSSVRSVSVAEVEDFARDNGLIFMEMSARTNENVDLTLSLLRIRAQHTLNADLHADLEDDEQESYSEGEIAGNGHFRFETGSAAGPGDSRRASTVRGSRGSHQQAPQPLSTCSFENERASVSGQSLDWAAGGPPSLAQSQKSSVAGSQLGMIAGASQTEDKGQSPLSPESMTISAILGRPSKASPPATFAVKTSEGGADEFDDSDRGALARDIQSLNINAGLAVAQHQDRRPGEPSAYSERRWAAGRDSQGPPPGASGSAPEWKTSFASFYGGADEAKHEVDRLDSTVRSALDIANGRSSALEGSGTHGEENASHVEVNGIRLHRGGGLTVRHAPREADAPNSLDLHRDDVSHGKQNVHHDDGPGARQRSKIPAQIDRAKRSSVVSAPPASRRFIRPEDMTLHKRATQSFARKVRDDDFGDDESVPSGSQQANAQRKASNPQRRRASSAASSTALSKPASEMSTPEMYVDVNMEGNLVGTISVHRGDDPSALASAFVVTHRLERTMQPKLRRLLHDRMIEFYGTEAQIPRQTSRPSSVYSSSAPTTAVTSAKNAGDKRGAAYSSRPGSRSESSGERDAPSAAPDQQRGSSRPRSLPRSARPSTGPVIGTLHVKVGPGRIGKLVVREGDDPTRLVDGFRKTFGLRAKQAAEIEERVALQLRLHFNNSQHDDESSDHALASVPETQRLLPRARRGDEAERGDLGLPSRGAPGSRGARSSSHRSNNHDDEGRERGEGGIPSVNVNGQGTVSARASLEQPSPYFDPNEQLPSPVRYPSVLTQRQRELLHATLGWKAARDAAEMSEGVAGPEYDERVEEEGIAIYSPGRSIHKPRSGPSAAPASKRKLAPLFHLDVNIGKSQMERISVHEGDDIAMLAQSFAEKHGLSYAKVPRLTFLLEEKLLLHTQQR